MDSAYVHSIGLQDGEIGSKHHMLTCIQDVKSQTKCHYENFTDSQLTKNPRIISYAK